MSLKRLKPCYNPRYDMMWWGGAILFSKKTKAKGDVVRHSLLDISKRSVQNVTY